MITQTNYDTTKQSIRNLHVKINLLNFNLQTVDDITGNVISGNISIDANSDIRRTANITLVVTDSSFDIASGGKIWLDKYIQVYMGIDDIRTGVIDWINQGIYLINNPQLEYDAVTNTLSFQGLDLMSKLTGVRNGYMDNIPTVINAGDNIRSVMISTLTQFSTFTRYAISNNLQTIPYEMKFEVGSTVYDVLSALRDITPNYEMFFDVDGTFVYQPIPTGLNDPVVADNDLWNSLVLSDSTDVNFDGVKNNIIVVGKAHDPEYYAEATLVGNEYRVTIADIATLEENMIIGFTATELTISPTLKVNDLTAQAIVNEDASTAVLSEVNGYYVVMVRADGLFLYLGRQQIVSDVSDDNVDSPYYINGTLGQIRLPLYGGEYDNIYSEDLAQQRAKYELWIRTRMNDAIRISCVPVYWLDVNQKISYSKLSGNGEIEYIIKSISFDLSETGTMEIDAIRFYQEYAELELNVDGGYPNYDYTYSFSNVDAGLSPPFTEYELIDAGGV